MHGLDLNAYKKGIEKDVFASDATGVHPRPYSTLSFIDQPETDTIYA